jgi:DNA-binding NarL/FixJ family response regulator
MSDNSLIRLLIVDDHAIFRAGLKMLLEEQPRIQLVGEAPCGADALALAEREQPDTVLLDLNLDGECDLDLLPRLQACASSARIIVLTGSTDADQHLRAVSLGAQGLVLKQQAYDVLVKAIHCVHRGEVWLERSMVARVLSTLASPDNHTGRTSEATSMAHFTPREREIIALVCEGLANKQIAARLHLSSSTVHNHLTSIFSKLHVSSRLELATYAHQHGLSN